MLGSCVRLLPTIPLMSAARVVKCLATVPVGWPGYPCVRASRMARYLRRLSLIVCSFWTGRSFQRVYDEPTSEVLISKCGTFHERAKVVDSLPGYTLGIVGCRHNLAPRAQRSRRRSFSADGTIRPLWSPCVGGRALQRLSVL